MFRLVGSALVAAALLLIPVASFHPSLGPCPGRGYSHRQGRHGRKRQSQNSKAKEEARADPGSKVRPRASTPVRPGMARSQEGRQDRKGRDLAEVLERLQHPAQGQGNLSQPRPSALNKTLRASARSRSPSWRLTPLVRFGLTVPSHSARLCLSARTRVNLVPLSRRRPLSSGEAGVAEAVA